MMAVLIGQGGVVSDYVLHSIALSQTRDKEGECSIVEEGGLVELLRALSKDPKRSKLLEIRNSEGDTPLHVAARTGHVALTRALVSVHEASTVIRNNSGLVPLHIAAMGGQDEVLLALLHGCSSESVRAKARDGRTALHFLAYGRAQPGSDAMGCSSAVEEPV